VTIAIHGELTAHRTWAGAPGGHHRGQRHVAAFILPALDDTKHIIFGTRHDIAHGGSPLLMLSL